MSDKMLTDVTILTPEILRNHADAPNSPVWNGQARLLLKWVADLLQAAEALRQDAEIGEVTMRFIDRLSDPCDSDPLTTSVREFERALMPIIVRHHDAARSKP